MLHTTCQHVTPGVTPADGTPCPQPATWQVGARGYARLLCDECAALPQYRRFKCRRRLVQGVDDTPTLRFTRTWRGSPVTVDDTPGVDDTTTPQATTPRKWRRAW
jgi:hypothetical protein